MNYLYYGNGDCTLSCPGAKAIEIRYSGQVTISKTCGDDYILMNNKSGVIIFSLGTKGDLTDLFSYKGNFKILSLLISDQYAEPITCGIKRVMDYAEMIDSKAEDLTTKSEDLSSSYYGKAKIMQKVDTVIENLKADGNFYLEDGSSYVGLYHIHLEDNRCMTGKEHTEDSVDLYIKQVYKDRTINRLIPTKNPSHKPLVIDFNSKKRRLR